MSSPQQHVPQQHVPHELPHEQRRVVRLRDPYYAVLSCVNSKTYLPDMFYDPTLFSYEIHPSLAHGKVCMYRASLMSPDHHL